MGAFGPVNLYSLPAHFPHTKNRAAARPGQPGHTQTRKKFIASALGFRQRPPCWPGGAPVESVLARGRPWRPVRPPILTSGANWTSAAPFSPFEGGLRRGAHMPFPGVDFLQIDPLLNDDERLVRQTARAICRPRSPAHHRKAQSRSHLPHAACAAAGRAGIFRRQPDRLRLRRHVQRRLRPGDAGARTRRFRPAQFRFGAERPGDVSHPRLWLA